MRRNTNRLNCFRLMLLVSLLILVPLIILPFYPEDGKYALAFIAPALGGVGVGGILCAIGRRDDGAPMRGGLIVLIAWGWGFMLGALPFALGGVLSPMHALFEAVSGWTTTGLSVMDVRATPRIYLFHRSFMQFCGGLGFVMMMVVFIHDKASMNMYTAEGHTDKLMPNLKKTARVIFLMYAALLALGTALLCAAGMRVFDSVCHAMCALSTGGFSTKLMSIGEYGSLPVELITILLMLIGATNFAALLLLAKCKFKRFARVSEARFMALLLLIFIPLIAFSLSDGIAMSAGERLRHAAFNAVSALSTTGYSTLDYTSLPPLTYGIIILLMLIGGGIGSTAGGIKLSRVYLMLRFTASNIRNKLTRARGVEAPYYYRAQGKTWIDDELNSDWAGYVICYMLIFIIGALLTTEAADCSLKEAMFEFASALGTVGLSAGVVSAQASAAALIILMCGMILGRLEIFIVLIGMCTGVNAIMRGVRRRIARS